MPFVFFFTNRYAIPTAAGLIFILQSHTCSTLPQWRVHSARLYHFAQHVILRSPMCANAVSTVSSQFASETPVVPLGKYVVGRNKCRLGGVDRWPTRETIRAVYAPKVFPHLKPELTAPHQPDLKPDLNCGAPEVRTLFSSESMARSNATPSLD
jgi:hypothetical protein